MRTGLRRPPASCRTTLPILPRPEEPVGIPRLQERVRPSTVGLCDESTDGVLVVGITGHVTHTSNHDYTMWFVIYHTKEARFFAEFFYRFALRVDGVLLAPWAGLDEIPADTMAYLRSLPCYKQTEDHRYKDIKPIKWLCSQCNAPQSRSIWMEYVFLLTTRLTLQAWLHATSSSSLENSHLYHFHLCNTPFHIVR